jgi:hypothetical protein
VGIGQVAGQEVWVSDLLAYGSLGADVAFGRFPDGDVYLSFLNMTPGNSNVLLGVTPPGGSLKGWRIYPNPATEYVVLEFEKASEYDAMQPAGTVMIYSVSGQLVKTHQLARGLQAVIDLSDLDRGVYILHLRGTNLTGKLIVH